MKIEGEKAKSSAKAQAGKTSETKKYTVKKGDSLNRIAKENNMTLDKLCQLNSLARKRNIYPGQVILVNK